ncbi:hypothetical protein FRC11_000986 [Ceratobasidium sp. 423]|nr:hypothetical protein FRC11_000986 [Ceratobasidium sp. 423]
MANSIAPYQCVWRRPELRLVELRAHEIVVGDAVQVEESLYGVIDAILHAVFTCQSPNPHIVHPQGPLRAIPERPPTLFSTTPQHSPSPQHSSSSDISNSSEPVPDWSSEPSIEISASLAGKLEADSNDSPANQSNVADAGNNSGAVGGSFFPPPGDVSMTNFHLPTTGRGQAPIKKGDLLKPDFLVYKANPNGCFTEGGGPDTLRLVVEVKSGRSQRSQDRLTTEDKHRLRRYFLRVRRMGAVGTGVLLIVKGDAYFWYYDELENPSGIGASIELAGRYSRKIDDWGFIRFLMRWESGEQGVRFPSQDVPMQ